MQQEFKILESHIRAGEKGVPEIELGKSKIDAHHGEVIVDHKKDETRNQEEEEDPVAADFLNEAVFMPQDSFFSFHCLTAQIAGCAERKGDIDGKSGMKPLHPVVMVGEEDQSECAGCKQEGKKHPTLKAAVHAKKALFRRDFFPGKEQNDAPGMKDGSRCGNEEQDEGPQAEDALFAVLHKSEKRKDRITRLHLFDRRGLQLHHIKQRIRICQMNPGNDRNHQKQ